MGKYIGVLLLLTAFLAVAHGTPPAKAGGFQEMVSQRGERCWGGPSWFSPDGITVPGCTAWTVYGSGFSPERTLDLNWSQEQIRISSPSGAMLGVWSDYRDNVSMVVTFPNGTQCTGRSFEVVPGVTTVRVRVDHTAGIQQGPVSGQVPDCLNASGSNIPPPPFVVPPFSAPTPFSPPGRWLNIQCWSTPEGLGPCFVVGSFP